MMCKRGQGGAVETAEGWVETGGGGSRQAATGQDRRRRVETGGGGSRQAAMGMI
jgi:hypothetical protein